MFDDEFDPWPEIAPSLQAAEAADDMGIQILYVHGDEHFAHCPLPEHPGADASPSFSFNDDKLVYNCFVCGGGSFVKLTEKVLDVSRDAALDWLIGYSDYDANDDGTFLKQIERIISAKPERIRQYEERSLPWYPQHKCEEWHALAREHRLDWFTSLDVERPRYIDEEVFDHLKFGWSPDLTTKVSGELYTGPAILIPHIVGGDLVGYQRRWEDDPRPKGLGKYTNTPDFPREFTLYNQDMLRRSVPTVVVESPMSVARLLSFGQMAVGTFGAKVTPQQIRILRGLDEVWIAMDNDEAGERATKTLRDGLDDHCIVKVIPPPSGDKGDLGDLADDELAVQLDQIYPSILWRPAL